MFAQCGFHQAKVEEIAIRAGVGKGTVYEYFRSKSELFEEVLKEVHNRYLEILGAELRSPLSCGQRINNLFQASFGFLKGHRETAQILLTDYPKPGKEFRQCMLARQEELLSSLAGLVAEGVEKEEFRPLEPGAAAQVIYGVILAFGSQMVFGKGAVLRESIAKETSEILLKGLSR